MPATTYTLSGSAGSAGAGALITLSGPSSATTTAAAGTGAYSFAGLVAGVYTVTASLTGEAFSPPVRTATIVAANVTGVNFSLYTPSAVGSNDTDVLDIEWNLSTRVNPEILGTNLGTRIT